jgi:hypothetical protein
MIEKYVLSSMVLVFWKFVEYYVTYSQKTISQKTNPYHKNTKRSNSINKAYNINKTTTNHSEREYKANKN